MKSRNREVNIFNMSLLDILCGALGAFCFMMLSLLPYYHPPGEDYKKVTEEQKKLLEEIKDIKDLARRLKFTSNAEDQRELVEKLLEEITKLENRIKALQGQVNSLMAEKTELENKVEDLKRKNEELLASNKQLEQDKQNLQLDNDKLRRQLKYQVPWLLAMQAIDTSQGLDLYLQEVKIANTSKKMQPDFNPNEGLSAVFWPGDYVFRYFPTVVWVSQDRYPGCEIRAYVQLNNAVELRKATEVSGHINGWNMATIAMPRLPLTPQRPWSLVGTITVGDDMVPKFVAATQAQRDAEWTRLTKTPPPPPPAPAAPAISSEEAAERLRRTEAMRRRTVPGGGTAPSTEGLDPATAGRLRKFVIDMGATKTDAEKQQVFQKALKDAASDQERAQISGLMSNMMRGSPPANPPSPVPATPPAPSPK